MATAQDNLGNAFNLDSVRNSLIRQEDTIVFNLIERAKFPINSPLYNQTLNLVPGFSGSLLRFIIKETEAIQAKVIKSAIISFSYNACLLVLWVFSSNKNLDGQRCFFSLLSMSAFGHWTVP